MTGRRLEDATLAAYLAELHARGQSPGERASPAAVAAACFRAGLAGGPSPAGKRTTGVLAGYRRTRPRAGAGVRGTDVVAILATCHRPRRRVRPGRP